jgi:hypothetical protein
MKTVARVQPNPTPALGASPTPADAGPALYCGVAGCWNFVTYQNVSRGGRVRDHRERHMLKNRATRRMLECPAHAATRSKVISVDRRTLIAIGRGQLSKFEQAPSDAIYAMVGRDLLRDGFLAWSNKA